MINFYLFVLSVRPLGSLMTPLDQDTIIPGLIAHAPAARAAPPYLDGNVFAVSLGTYAPRTRPGPHINIP